MLSYYEEVDFAMVIRVAEEIILTYNSFALVIKSKNDKTNSKYLVIDLDSEEVVESFSNKIESIKSFNENYK